MTIGNFGGIVFEVSDKKVQTFRNFSRQSSGDWATHGNISGKPKSEFVGQTLQTISFDMELKVMLGANPRELIDRLIEIAETGEVDYLIIGGRPIGENQWKIKSLSEEWGEVLSRGELLSASVSITLEEYV